MQFSIKQEVTEIGIKKEEDIVDEEIQNKILKDLENENLKQKFYKKHYAKTLMPIIGYCGSCEKFFHEPYDYLKHMQNKHQNHAPKYSLFQKVGQNENVQDLIYCKFCTKKFSFQEIYEKHLLIKHPFELSKFLKQKNTLSIEGLIVNADAKEKQKKLKSQKKFKSSKTKKVQTDINIELNIEFKNYQFESLSKMTHKLPKKLKKQSLKRIENMIEPKNYSELIPETNFLHDNQGVLTYYYQAPPSLRILPYKIRDLLKSYIECFGYNFEKNLYLEIIEIFNIFINFLQDSQKQIQELIQTEIKNNFSLLDYLNQDLAWLQQNQEQQSIINKELYIYLIFDKIIEKEFIPYLSNKTNLEKLFIILYGGQPYKILMALFNSLKLWGIRYYLIYQYLETKKKTENYKEEISSQISLPQMLSLNRNEYIFQQLAQLPCCFETLKHIKIEPKN